MSKLNEIETFIVFCLEAYRDKLDISGKEALDEFKKFDVFTFLENEHVVLHTQSLSYVVDEIQNYIEVRR
jgi:hypothetical protein